MKPLKSALVLLVMPIIVVGCAVESVEEQKPAWDDGKADSVWGDVSCPSPSEQGLLALFQTSVDIPEPLYVEMGLAEDHGECEPGFRCRFVVEVNDPWQQRLFVARLRRQSNRRIITATLRLSESSYNVDESGERWPWHAERPSIALGAREFCDVHPGHMMEAVETGLFGEGSTVCFWYWDVLSIRRADGSVVDPTPQGPLDCWDASTSECSSLDGCIVSYQDAEYGEYVCQEPFGPEDECPGNGDRAWSCQAESVEFATRATERQLVTDPAAQEQVVEHWQRQHSSTPLIFSGTLLRDEDGLCASREWNCEWNHVMDPATVQLVTDVEGSCEATPSWLDGDDNSAQPGDNCDGFGDTWCLRSSRLVGLYSCCEEECSAVPRSGAVPGCGESCADRDIGSATGEAGQGDTAGQGDDVRPSCGSSSAEDVTFSFRAPRSGSYTIDTLGSNFDTIVEVRNGGCDGQPMACNDDYQGRQSLVTVELEEEQKVIIIVDGYSTASGTFVLNITAPEEATEECGEADIGTQTGESVGSGTTSGESEQSGSCGGGRAPEEAYAWSAPSSGTYTFDTLGSSYDTVIYLRDGGCSGEQIACNDDWSGLQSMVTVELDQGQQIVVFVDGYSTGGDYTLNIIGPITD